MIAERLRKAVLQAAIQGNLTEQHPEDGDARDLVRKIKAEREKLVKAGKMKKQKRLPEITDDEIPFAIPENWCWVRLGELAWLINGDRGKNYPGKSYWTSSGVPFINAGALNNSVLTDECLNYISEERFKLLRSGFVEKNDFLYCLRGSLGKFALNLSFSAGAIASSLVIIRMINTELCDYFRAYLGAPIAQEMICRVDNGTAQPNLSAENVRQYLVPLPPLAEQQRIVAKLEEVLPEIDKLQADEETLLKLQNEFPRKLKNSLLQAAIQGKLTEQLPEDGDAKELLAEIAAEKERLVKEGKIKKQRPLPEISEDEIPFVIPDNWCWVRLGEVTDYGVGKQVSKELIPEGSWILELADIEKESCTVAVKCFDRVPGSSKNRFYSGDVLYGKLRPYLKKTIVADQSGYCSTEIIPFRGYFGIDSRYLMYCMISPSVDYIVNSLTYGMDMPRLGTNDARSIIIPLPPTHEQQRIAAKLEELLPLCDKLGV